MPTRHDLQPLGAHGHEDETPAPAPAPKHRLRCTFIPQAWVNNYAVTVDPEGPTSWDTDWFGAALPAPNDYESDQLRDGADAPRWVKDWSGPFEVEYEVIPDTTETPAPAPTAHTPEPWSMVEDGGGSAFSYELRASPGDVFALENRIRDAAADALLYPLGQHTRRRIGNLTAEVRRRCGEPGSDNDSERYTRRHLLPLVERLTAYVDTMPADPDDARDIAADLLALLGEK